MTPVTTGVIREDVLLFQTYILLKISRLQDR